MAEISKVYRIANPGKRAGKEPMTLKQKLYFGTPSQRAAARAELGRTGNPSRSSTARAKRKLVRKVHRKLGLNTLADNNKGSKYMSPQYLYKMDSSRSRGRQKKAPAYREGNPAQIITLTNPGTKRTSSIMKKRYTKKRTSTTRRRRRTNSGLMNTMARRGRARRTANTGTRRKYYTKRRRNAGFGASSVGSGLQSAVGVIGGGLATSIVTSQLPAGINTGIAGYLATAAVAMVQGAVAGKVFKSPALGRSMTIGGFTYLALRLLQDFVPNLSLPFRIGAIAPSSFYTPQVPVGNSMINFQTPNAVMSAMPVVPMAGRMGRVGRVR